MVHWMLATIPNVSLKPKNKNNDQNYKTIEVIMMEIHIFESK